jgi:hypothetical protein
MKTILWKPRAWAAVATSALALIGASHAAVVSFSQLTGQTATFTGVYKADLSGVGLTTIESVRIADASGGVGGANGQFSGFDLDAIRLSYVDCATAACAATATAEAVFDFSSGAFFNPGAQRLPFDPKLAGTGPAGNTLDNSVATLQDYDGSGTTGFISLGDNGVILFNLTAALNTTGLFLYIGEVGDNGEVAASSVTVSDQPGRLPAPAMGALLLLGLAAMRARKV